MSPNSLTELLKQEAKSLGFDLVGACPAVAPDGFHRLREWIDAGYAGEMMYLPDRLDAYRDPSHVLDGARSVLMLAMNYFAGRSGGCADSEGRVSCYAWGSRDYHDVIHERLARLHRFLLDLVPDALVRGVVDTAPLLEREFAQLAGLGWIGKNTLLINKQAGSWLFLAALLTDQQLEYDLPHAADHCGACRACLDACPSDAFPRPYVLDATRCISYLTIELRSTVPLELRTVVGDWLFGCDVCQEVCPWNRHAVPRTEASFAPAAQMNPVELNKLFELSEEVFRQRFRHTPLWRAKRRGILRNAATVLGNKRSPKGLDALARGLKDEEPLVREACAWALGQLHTAMAIDVLRDRIQSETDTSVKNEILRALSRSE